jgi:hypothetical protein
MDQDIQKLTSAAILQALAKLFRADAHDRHVYCVFGPYERLRPFQKRLREQVDHGNFNERGEVQYLSLNRDIIQHMKAKGSYDRAASLARRRMDAEFRQFLSENFRDLVTSRIEANDALGLVLADFELLYAYDLGNHDIPIARQVAINGKRVCLLVPGHMRDRRLWIFDADPESRCEFPDALVFKNSGWVFELAD